MIAPQNEPAAGAVMSPLRELFGDLFSASATELRGTAWVHCDSPLTSLFRFTSKLPNEFSPSGIKNGFCQARSGECSNIQLLKGEQIIARHQGARDGMQIRASPACDPLVQAA